MRTFWCAFLFYSRTRFLTSVFSYLCIKPQRFLVGAFTHQIVLLWRGSLPSVNHKHPHCPSTLRFVEGMLCNVIVKLQTGIDFAIGSDGFNKPEGNRLLE